MTRHNVLPTAHNVLSAAYYVLVGSTLFQKKDVRTHRDPAIVICCHISQHLCAVFISQVTPVDELIVLRKRKLFLVVQYSRVLAIEVIVQVCKVHRTLQ